MSDLTERIGELRDHVRHQIRLLLLIASVLVLIYAVLILTWVVR